MIDEAKKTRIVELRESGLTIKEVGKACEVSESTVQRYSLNDYEKDNELDEKISDEMTNIMSLEGYDYEDETKPLVYTLKAQANELDITLHDYLNDIKNAMNKFLRLTDTPERFYYVFCELANNLSLITGNIEAKNLIIAIDNFYDRELAMEDADKYLAESKTERKDIITELKEMWYDFQKRTENAKKEAMSEVESKSKTILKNSKESYAEYKEKINSAKKDLDSINITRTLLIEELEKIEKIKIEIQALKSENQNLKFLLKQTNEEKTMMELIYERVSAIFPNECISVLKEIENERK